jgi:hypothetical protein
LKKSDFLRALLTDVTQGTSKFHRFHRWNLGGIQIGRTPRHISFKVAKATDNLPDSQYIMDYIFDSDFVEPVRFLPVVTKKNQVSARNLVFQN